MNIEDTSQLITYLQSRGHLNPHETPAIKVLAGGVSNRTVLVQRKNGTDLVIKQALEKLRVKEDWFSDPARIHREAEGIRLLSKVASPGSITPLVFEDKAHQLLAMEAVPEPHVNWKHELLAGKVDTGIVTQFGQCLGRVHRTFQLDDYPADGIIQGLDFFESLRLEPYYLFSAERVPVAASFLQNLVEETRKQKLTLVHGDYSPKNILIHKGQLVLLDHEVIHLGDPAFDIGFSMTHLLSKAHHLPEVRNTFVEAAHLYWDTYCQEIKDVSWLAGFGQRAIKHTLGCLLARVVGRSPLEYLSVGERSRQQAAVLALIETLPLRIADLIDSFTRLIDRM